MNSQNLTPHKYKHEGTSHINRLCKKGYKKLKLIELFSMNEKWSTFMPPSFAKYALQKYVVFFYRDAYMKIRYTIYVRPFGFCTELNIIN